jgi:aminoglycoside phosphotransferase (APT) family kinase protein
MGKADAGRIDTRVLADALSTAGIEVERLTFTASWEGTSYIGSDRIGRRFFVKAFDPEWRPRHLEATLAGALALHDLCALRAVVPPVRLAAGSLVLEVCEHSVAVFDVIDGISLAAGATPGDRADIADFVRALHDCGECLSLLERAPQLPRETFKLGFEGLLEQVQQVAEDEQVRGSAAQQAASLIRSAASEIAHALNRTRDLKSVGAFFVPTHGDLNLGNFIRQRDGGLRVIDWTKLALTPRERDLLGFADARFPEFLDAYARGSRNVALDAGRFEYYIWRERLASVVDYGSLLLLEHGSKEDQAHALAELSRILPIDLEAIAGWISWITQCARELT